MTPPVLPGLLHVGVSCTSAYERHRKITQRTTSSTASSAPSAVGTGAIRVVSHRSRRELAPDDLRQLARLLRRHAGHVRRGAEVRRADRGCPGRRDGGGRRGLTGARPGGGEEGRPVDSLGLEA